MNPFRRLFRSGKFVVTLGEIARTVDYHDSEGTLTFTFDFLLDGNPDPSLLLEHFCQPEQRRTPRYALAFERTRCFLESWSGKPVGVLGDLDNSAPLTAEEVAARIDVELASHPQPLRTYLDLKRCLVPPKLVKFRNYHELWLVFEEHPLTHDGWKIVFDEFSGDFGVVIRDEFGGFEGTFIQTLEAVSKFP